MNTNQLLSKLNRLLRLKEVFANLLVNLDVHLIGENLSDEIIKGVVKVETGIIQVKLELKNANKSIDQC